jgi:hypothetical protein
VTEFVAAVQSLRPILTDGGIETRIMFGTDDRHMRALARLMAAG